MSLPYGSLYQLHRRRHRSSSLGDSRGRHHAILHGHICLLVPSRGTASSGSIVVRSLFRSEWRVEFFPFFYLRPRTCAYHGISKIFGGILAYAIGRMQISIPVWKVGQTYQFQGLIYQLMPDILPPYRLCS